VADVDSIRGDAVIVGVKTLLGVSCLNATNSIKKELILNTPRGLLLTIQCSLKNVYFIANQAAMAGKAIFE
jgi:hypothetical protein